MATRVYLNEQQLRPSAAPASLNLPIATSPSEVARRTLNVCVAAIGIVLTAPLMLVIAALIKATSRGPILYTQTRVGIDRRARRSVNDGSTRDRNLGGAPFRIYKFRTMRAAQSAEQVWARQGDSRVTRVGAVLRKLRLDELPQLFNVLRGDMNVVGPRPEQPEIFGRLREQIASYPWRQRVLPGITGWAQINLRYDETVDDVRKKVAYDLAYIRKASAAEDLRIMVRTLPVMLGSRLGW
ncbi:MAG TPA: sugar transferase [Gemmatimonadaceae bacterium]|nr:sugar transferase [Gemmatimonadaceae bacterium]